MSVQIVVDLVINQCYGGFGLSHQAVMNYAARKGLKLTSNCVSITNDVYREYHKEDGSLFVVERIPRNDPDLVHVVRNLGKKANGPYADLCVVQKTVHVEIRDYDGFESV